MHFAAFVWFRYASLLANILRDVQQIGVKFPALGTNLKIHAKICMKLQVPAEIVNCRGSFNRRQNETVCRVLWFSSPNQTTGDFKPPPPPSPLPAKLAFKCPTWMWIFHWRMLCVINDCCRIWQSHLLVLLPFLGYFAHEHVSSMRNFSF